MTLGKHAVHLSFLIILAQSPGKATDRSPLANQAATGPDSAAQQTASPEPREKHAIQGQVVVLALQFAGSTRLVLSVSGKNGQRTIEFVMTNESHATPGLKNGATVIVAYHDHKENQKKVHLVSLVRVVSPPQGPISEERNPAPGPTVSPSLKEVTPLGPEQGAVTENIPGVFEKNWRPSHQGGNGSLGALTGGLAGGGKGSAIGAAAGTAVGAKGGSASTASGQAVASGKTGSTESHSSGANSSQNGIKTVSGKVLSWGAEFLLLDTKDLKTDTHNILKVFITDNSEFEKDVSLDDEVVVTYQRKQEENIAMAVHHQPTSVNQ